MTLLFAVFLAFSLPQFGYSFFAWFSLAPLILLIKFNRNIFLCLLESFLYLFIFNLMAFSWISSLDPLTWLNISNVQSKIIAFLAVLTPSFFHSLLMMIFVFVCYLFYRFKNTNNSYNLNFIEILILSFLWIVIEYKLIANPNNIFSSFTVPTNFLAYSQYRLNWLIQITDHIGAAGLEFLIVLINISLSLFVNYDKSAIEHRALRTSGAGKSFAVMDIINLAFIASFILLSFYGIYNYAHHKKIKLEARFKRLANIELDLIQASNNPRRRYSYNTKTKLRSQLALSTDQALFPIDEKIDAKAAAVLTQQTPIQKNKFLIWAEGTMPNKSLYSLKKEFDFDNYIKENYSAFIYGFTNYESESKPSKTKVYNSLVLRLIDKKDLQKFETELKVFDSNQDSYNFPTKKNLSQLRIEENQIYNKHILVPFGEYTPLKNIFPKFIQKLADETVGSGFDAEDYNTQHKPLNYKFVKFIPSICFEIMFPRHFNKSKGNILLNISDLKWFSSEAISKIYIAAAKFRAIEQSKYFVVNANSGPSLVIDPLGRINYQSRWQEKIKLKSKAQLSMTDSFYKKFTW